MTAPESEMTIAAVQYTDTAVQDIVPFEEEEPLIVEVEEQIAVAAMASAPSPAMPGPTPEDAKNDLELPAFMRRERRLFQ